MNEGHHILHLKYGKVQDWNMSESEKQRKIEQIGTDNLDGRHEFVEAKNAVEKLLDIIHEKHEKDEFDRHFDSAESALKGMLEELYGLTTTDFSQKGGRE